MKAGVHALRFTGSEIYKDPLKCSQEVEDHLSDLADDLLRRARTMPT